MALQVYKACVSLEDSFAWRPSLAPKWRKSSQSIPLPTTLPTGSYALLLNLPDPAASLNTRPEYAIQLANTNVWEATTGFNDLRWTVTVQ